MDEPDVERPAETLLHKLLKLRNEPMCGKIPIDIKMSAILTNLNEDPRLQIHKLHDELELGDLHWRLICTKVRLSIFYDIALSRAIMVEEGLQHSMDVDMILKHDKLTQTIKQVVRSRCSAKRSNCSENHIDFVPFRKNLDSSETWKQQVAWFTEDNREEFNDDVKMWCENILLQIEDVVRLESVMGDKWERYAELFRYPDFGAPESLGSTKRKRIINE